MRVLHTVALALFLVLSASAGRAAGSADYLWLEDIEAAKSLDWVRARNAVSQKELESSPDFKPIYERLLAIYDSNERIPAVSLRDGWLYNFWKDAQHPRGLWRRTRPDEYRKASPRWETVLDLDALSASEKQNWVWKGAECLYPQYRRCLLKLSRGGADAHIIREFDTGTRSFVTQGFELPEGKHEIVWRSVDSLLVATDTKASDLTSSGYPRIVREWKRGTPLAGARVVYEGKAEDVAVGVAVQNEPGRQREIVQRAITFFEFEYFLRAGDHLAKLDVPADADLSLFQDQLLLQLRSDWEIVGHRYVANSLIAMPLVAFIEGQRTFDILFAPSEKASLVGYSKVRNGLLLNLLDRVRGRVTALRYARGRWSTQPVSVPEFGEAEATALNDEESDAYLLTTESFTSPTRLLDGALGRDDHRTLKQLPAFFKADGIEVEQREAISKDGTKVPYFQVGRAGMKTDGKNPTLLYGYGGFEIALTPGYHAARRCGLAGARRHLRSGQHPRWRRVRPTLAPGRGAAESPARLRRLRGHRRRPHQARRHVAAASGHPGRQQRRPADGRGHDPASRVVRRRRLPGSAARHAPLSPAAGRCELDERVRESGRPGTVGIPVALLAVPEPAARREIPGRADHHLDARRSRASGARAQDDRSPARAGSAGAVLREHRRRSRRRGEQSPEGLHGCAVVHVSLEAIAVVARTKSGVPLATGAQPRAPPGLRVRQLWQRQSRTCAA
jgi:hypothetical protein